MPEPDRPIEIITGVEDISTVKVELQSKLAAHLGQRVSISLRYYQKKPECWSDWSERELKAFTKMIGQLRDQTSEEIKGRGATGSPPCKIHKGECKTSGFTRPTEISEDLAFYELKATDKARLHGFFVDNVFFLVWLDRNHRAFP